MSCSRKKREQCELYQQVGYFQELLFRIGSHLEDRYDILQQILLCQHILMDIYKKMKKGDDS